jgi:hypothetical protein
VAVRPFLVEGADEAFDLGVPARRPGWDEDVLDLMDVESGLERAAVAVGKRVVSHDRLGRSAALSGKPGEGRLRTAAATSPRLNACNST